MPRPGRRRAADGASCRFYSILALVLVFLSPSVLGANAVLGIDVGTEYLKAALVKPGIPLEIVLTKDSKRKEASAIAFKTSPYGPQSDDQLPERLYGGDALALSPRIPGDVYPNLKHLLGASQQSGEKSLNAYKLRYPALDMYEYTNGSLGFKSKSFAGSFSVEELFSMELKSIRENAERMASSTVKDAVITIPAFYTADERRAMEAAAELAGLRVLGVLSDGMAVGLNYATSRTFGNIDEGGKAEYHLVYDMGAGSTTATVLRMQGKRVKDVGRFNKTVQEVSTLGVGWDRTLGGDALNDLIVGDMIQKFVGSAASKKANIEAATIKTHGRTMAKLWKESERLRQILSANTASSSFFEGLYDDIDFRYKLSRSDFESMASEYSARLSGPINDALQSAGMTFEDITSVILHGGAVRTPFVQSSLEALAGGVAKLKSNVNADEAAVFGAAFKAAGMSPSFRVKEILANDVALYPVTLHWTSGSKERKQQIFTPTSTTGNVKQMPFKLSEDFSFGFRQTVSDLGVELPVLDLKTTNLTQSVAKLIIEHDCVKENITTLISIRLDPTSGLPEVTKGSVSCQSATSEKKGMMDGVKDMLGFRKKDQQSSSEEDEGELLEPLTESSLVTLSSKTTTSTATVSTTGKDKAAQSTPVKKTHTINLGFSSTKLGLKQPTGSELERIKEGLALFDKSDRNRRLREELFNGLEAYTYRVRDMLTDNGFMSVSTAGQRTAIETLLGITSEWLQSEGITAARDAIKEKLQGLKALVDPVQSRKDEITNRPNAIEALQISLKSASSLKDTVSAQLAKVAEAASSSVVDASSLVSSAVSSVTNSLNAEATDGAPTDASKTNESVPDDQDDATSTVSSIAAKFSSYVDPWAFTDTDLITLTEAYDEVTEWLSSSLTSQSALKDSDEPALLSADVEKTNKQLRKVLEEIERKIRFQSRASSSTSTSSSTKKSSRSTTKTSRTTTASTEGAEETEAAKEAETSATEIRPKDEL